MFGIFSSVEYMHLYMYMHDCILYQDIITGNDAVEYMNQYYASAGFDLLDKFDTPWHPNLNMFGEYKGLS